MFQYVKQFHGTNAFPFKNKHYNKRNKQNCEDVRLAPGSKAIILRPLPENFIETYFLLLIQIN